MRSVFFILFNTAALHWLAALAFPISALLKLEPRATLQGIDQQTYDQLVLARFDQGGEFQPNLGNKCASNSQVHVFRGQFSNHGTRTFVARDDNKKEIVVAFRGTENKLDDILKDLLIWRKSLDGVIGLSNVGSATAHSGFISAFNAVGQDMLGVVSRQASEYPSYRIVLTGHSMGGAVASLGALVVKSALPQANVVLYTYGQPRVGNADFASYVENMIGGNNISRAVHTNDWAPLVLLPITGYRHFATEYWNFKDPASPATVAVTSIKL
ncbi:unnamed protein product [Cyclocybe aegerita]|uniref:Fungal lipase-type domain-containing protein n=1 Tax=Cyclocybe aegerita TaxID=1973307 RepID=A0A8S0W5D5_CYCAE|nr:unnamed protein product [Cyclocybe aegerita]